MRTPDVAAVHDSSVTSHGPVLKFVLRHSPVPQWYKGVSHREIRIPVQDHISRTEKEAPPQTVFGQEEKHDEMFF